MTFRISEHPKGASPIKGRIEEQKMDKKLPKGGWSLVASYVFESRETAVGFKNQFLEHTANCDHGGCRIGVYEAKVIKRGAAHLVIFRTTSDNNE